MIASALRPRLLQNAAIGLAGAVAGAVVVHVSAGSVRVDDGAHVVVVEAGSDRVLPVVATMPTPVPATQTKKTKTAATEDVAAADADLAAENARLRKLLAAQDEELKLADDVIDDAEGGAPRRFPPNLSPRLTEVGLRDAFAKGFAEAGIDGAVTSIDCAEYPCIVWGEFNFDGSELADTMNETPVFAPYKDDGKWVRSWGIGDGKEVFAITLVPPRSEVERDDLFDKRVRFRTEQGEKQWKREHAEDAKP